MNKLLHKGSKVIQHNTAQDTAQDIRKLGDRLGDTQDTHQDDLVRQAQQQASEIPADGKRETNETRI